MIREVIAFPNMQKTINRLKEIKRPWNLFQTKCDDSPETTEKDRLI